MFRLLCTGRKECYEDLCKIFSDETNDGRDMSTYSEMMKTAVSDVAALLGKRNELQLEGRGGKLIDEDELPKAENDFELITWIIINNLNPSNSMDLKWLNATSLKINDGKK
jgi:hypothetical protein